MADKIETMMMPALHREAAIVPGSLDEKQRTFDIVWTAGAEVPRVDWWTGQRYVEVLQVDQKSIRLDKRFQSGSAPVLDSHQRWTLGNQLGNVVKDSVRIADGKATLRARMSNRPEVAGIVGDIRDGIISNVSPGYITHAYREEIRDGVTYRIVTDWEPIELSFVPVGADPDAGKARSLTDIKRPELNPCVVTRSLEAAQARNPEPPADTDHYRGISEAPRARMRMLARAFGLEV
jgi:hypothetical protein